MLRPGLAMTNNGMLKKSKKIYFLPRIFLAILLVAISLQTASLAFLIWTPKIAQAESMEMKLQVPIPGLPSTINFGDSTEPIAKYIQAIYNYAIGVVGILAAVVMMIGGLMWITAGGNTSNIGEAKAMITASLTGLVLVLVSYLLLLQVNPALVNLQSSIISPVTPAAKTIGQNVCTWYEAAKTVSGGGFSYECQTGKTQMSDACDQNTKPQVTTAGNLIICCCEKQTFTASGQCQKGVGSCSPSNLSIFGGVADQASAICQGESGGTPGIPSGTDICADGKSASWGLFQINISANPIGGLDCPSAFSSPYTANDHSCTVKNQALYNQCVTAAKNPGTNAEQAYLIYSNAGKKWMPWGFYQRACSQSF